MRMKDFIQATINSLIIFFIKLRAYLVHYFNKLRSLIIKLRSIKRNPTSLSPIKSPAHWMLWGTFWFVIVFLFWAKFAVLDEVTVATATVIPLTHVQSIQNMEGGIIKSITVHEGDIVEKGQIVVVLDPTRFASALNEARAREVSLQVKIARLTAETNKQPFEIPAELSNTTNAGILSQIKGQQDLYDAHQNQLKQLEQNLSLLRQELTMTKPLVSEGAASQVEVLHLERQQLEIVNQIDQFYAHALDELATAKGERSSVLASMQALQDRLNRTTIRSPVKGIVKQIRIATKDSVVPPGAEIMSIVPIEDTLLIEAQVKPSDIGFIHAGEEVTVKITAYDYSVYGGLNGYVDKVSADTITDAKGKSFYMVRVKTEKNYLRTAHNPLYIIPGMTATVSILTGRKTVLNYLISPLVKAKENALRER